ncbi:hypothetical protein QFC20_004124 [Naganishia adeliensis]|uniref:Uncharacterized protein n=1 Tax=Naganishia adeliensis TaxID=92952 RepID=A0ACC2W4Q9_9TREE|nr:hypothetical protein QFC20_004124 [Naganishia adeliensis]
MTVIAIAGGSGKLGRAVAEAIVAKGKYQVLILARSVDEEKQKEVGATFVVADYTTVDSLFRVLEDNKIDTVISILHGMGTVDSELNLIQAADKSAVTKRYIPNIWGARVTEEIAEFYPPGKGKIAVLRALESTSLEYTAIYTGYFIDFFVAPYVKTYMLPMSVVIDIPNHFAAIPGTGDVLVDFVYTLDIAKYVAALQGLPKWEKESVIVGDKITLNEFVKLAEQVKGKKFTIVHDSMEKLRSGQITELPFAFRPLPGLPEAGVAGVLCVV